MPNTHAMGQSLSVPRDFFRILLRTRHYKETGRFGLKTLCGETVRDTVRADSKMKGRSRIDAAGRS
jgi:hypothetical protein